MKNWDSLRNLETGLVGITQLPLSRPSVPAVELEGDHLHWSPWSETESLPTRIDVSPFPGSRDDTKRLTDVPLHDLVVEPSDADITGALDRFTRLQSKEDVLRFANRFGVLDICEHGLPSTHNPRFLSVPLIGLVQSPSLWKPAEFGEGRERGFLIQESGERPWCEPTGCEPIEIWLFWSRISAAMLNVSAALTNHRPTAAEDWETIITEDTDERQSLIESVQSRTWIARVYLTEAVNRWLHLANVWLSLSWPIGAEIPKLELAASTFGVLGVQLLTAVTGSQSLTVCSGCGNPYLREGRRPQAGRANYCRQCRADKAPERIRQRRKRARAKDLESRETSEEDLEGS